MSLTLTVSDNEDGSGGVATVSGSDTASANTLFSSPYAGIQQNLTWRSAGSRTGDGAIAVAPTLGMYFWYATGTVSSVAALSNIVFRELTSDEISVHYRVLTAYVQRIRGLELKGILNKNVAIAWFPQAWDTLVQLPCVLVTPVGKEGQPGILSGRDDIEYPVMVALIDLKEGWQGNMARNVLWRQEIFRAFRHQRLAGVPEIITTDVEPQPITDAAWWLKNNWYSAILFKPRSREVRG